MGHRPWFVFAGGGTGGHLFPALAVVESLRERGEGIDVSFFCTERALDREILGAAQVEAVPLGVQPVPSRPWRWPGFLLRWRASVSLCKRAFSDRQPAVVIGAGGYASGPPVAAALRLGVPTFLLNPDAVPGLANQHLARRRGMTGVFAQWPVTRDRFPPPVPVMVTGCPVRRAFCSFGGVGMNARGAGAEEDSRGSDVMERRVVEEARQSLGLDPGRRTLLVTGASQGARTVNEAMIRLAGVVASWGWQVLHLSGSADRERVARAYAEAGTPGAVYPFTDRMADAMVAANLIVSRAGASTLAEILAVGRPAMLLPYPFHRDRHQWHNGAVLVEAGAAVMLEDLKDASANVRQMSPVLTSLVTDDARRDKMAAAARALGRPDAADRVADRLCEAAKTGDRKCL